MIGQIHPDQFADAGRLTRGTALRLLVPLAIRLGLDLG